MIAFLIPVTIPIDNLIDNFVAPIHANIMKNAHPALTNAKPNVKKLGTPFAYEAAKATRPPNAPAMKHASKVYVTMTNIQTSK